MSLLERVARWLGFERVRVVPPPPNQHTMAWYLDKMYAFEQAHGFRPSDIYVHPDDEVMLAPLWHGFNLEGLRALGVTWHVSISAQKGHPILWHELLNPSVRRFTVQKGESIEL